MSPPRRAAVAASRLRAVLWDLDGTLTDSVRLVVETMNSVFAAHGGPRLPYEKVGELTGLPLDAMFRLVWPDIGAADVERYRVEYRAQYDAVAIPATRLYRGARTTLRDFHSAGLLQATVTGKRAADCERILRARHQGGHRRLPRRRFGPAPQARTGPGSVRHESSRCVS